MSSTQLTDHARNICYTPSTTQPTAFHNPPMHTTNAKHSLQNGTRCRDGVKVLWCNSHLVWLGFDSSIPRCACSHSENAFVTCLYTFTLISSLLCSPISLAYMHLSSFLMIFFFRDDGKPGTLRTEWNGTGSN